MASAGEDVYATVSSANLRCLRQLLTGHSKGASVGFVPVRAKAMRPKRKKYAYWSFRPGALVLAHSLKDAGTTKKIAVLVTTDTVSADAMAQLQVRTTTA
jgi:hypothetical protein